MASDLRSPLSTVLLHPRLSLPWHLPHVQKPPNHHPTFASLPSLPPRSLDFPRSGELVALIVSLAGLSLVLSVVVVLACVEGFVREKGVVVGFVWAV